MDPQGHTSPASWSTPASNATPPPGATDSSASPKVGSGPCVLRDAAERSRPAGHLRQDAEALGEVAEFRSTGVALPSGGVSTNTALCTASSPLKTSSRIGEIDDETNSDIDSAQHEPDGSLCCLARSHPRRTRPGRRAGPAPRRRLQHDRPLVISQLGHLPNGAGPGPHRTGATCQAWNARCAAT